MNRLEIKSAFTADDAGTITGLAWPFGSPDTRGDVIHKGAFGAIQLPLPMLFAHNPNSMIGYWEQATETDRGLELKGKLLLEDVPRAREANALIRAGVMKGLSIGYSLKKATPRRGGGRDITAIDLVECSVVSNPAHPRAGIYSLKSNNDAQYLAELLRTAAASLRT